MVAAFCLRGSGFGAERWSGVPAGTHEFILICEDPDAPMPKPFVHWILHRLPPDITSLPEGVPLGLYSITFRGATSGKTGKLYFKVIE